MAPLRDPPPGFKTPPGTVKLLGEDGRTQTTELILQPTPSTDPNDPLNWTLTRKIINFLPCLAVTGVIFSQYSIVTVFWQLWIVDLDCTFEQLNNSQAIGLTGTAVGCMIFIPLAIKYGRRLIYIVSILVMLGMAIWNARMNSVTELYIISLITGLAGATNETIVQMTIADMFFVHQRATANGCYMGMVTIGSFLSPIVAGQIAKNGNWRLNFWILVAFDAIMFVYFLFLYEESKYIPNVLGQPQTIATSGSPVEADEAGPTGPSTKNDITDTTVPLYQAKTMQDHIDRSISMLPIRQRLRLITKTDESLIECVWRPFVILYKFPAVLYTALQYSFGLAWISVIGATISIIFPYPPYTFSPAGIGNMSLGPFIGCIIGSIYGGVLADRLIRPLAKRNYGYYEPEMRLHMNHLPAICMAGGILMFGLTVARGMHWIYPSIGGAFFGFGLGAISDEALTLVIDCYAGVTGEAFIAIAFVRNCASIAIYFALVPWQKAQGLQNFFIVIAVWSLVVAFLHLPLIAWGKKIRARTAQTYLHLVDTRSSSRY